MVIDDEIKDAMTVRHNRPKDGFIKFIISSGKIIATGVTVSIGTTTFLTNRIGGKCIIYFIM